MMVAPASFEWVFKGVAAFSKDRAFFVAAHRDAEEKNLPVSHVLRWKSGAWESKPFQVRATSLAVVHHPDPNLLVMSIDGKIVRWGAKDFSEEVVDTSKEGPQHIGDLREVREIGKRGYVAGMGRTAYRCDGPGTWVRVDKGVRVEKDDDSDSGFNSIHAFGEKDVYAAGFDGEIWSYDGKKWKKRETPTNLALYRVLCAPDGNVYAAGQLGTLLVGKADQWEVVKHDATREDFWGSAWFKGRFYVATSNGIFVLNKRTLEKLEVKPKGATTLKFGVNSCFSKLDAIEDVMWSVGTRMAMYTEDGATWTEVSYK
jgi:hypothetical protein